ncbi:glycosyltransferase family 2 protein [Candidatus Woesearchaeota archaeon]|nr:glycosyltransferase family 2 protein [Candidatus Woesearchaeota archaeon]
MNNPIIDIPVYIAYFIALYLIVYWLIFYVEKRSVMKRSPRVLPKELPLVTIIVPAYNEEKVITKTLRSIQNLIYPKDKLQVLIVNDGSKDRTAQVVESYIRKHKTASYMTLINQNNQGKAAALNNSVKQARGEYFACIDADSLVEPDALQEMIKGFFADSTIAIQFPVMKVYKPKSWIQKYQYVEYLASMIIIRLCSFIDANYVAPGPFSVYKLSVLKKLGPFDTESLVEDQEIAFRAQKDHFRLKQCQTAFVHTHAPKTISTLRRQRNRWFKGTILNLFKYRGLVMNRNYGDFGLFQLPMTILGLVLAIFGVFIFLYYFFKPIFEWFHHMMLVNFDIMPYLTDLEWKIKPLEVSLTPLFFIYVLLFMSLTMLLISSRFYKGRLKRNASWQMIPYFFIYFLLLGFFLIQVLVEILLGKKQKW